MLNNVLLRADVLALGDIWYCPPHCDHSTCSLVRSHLIQLWSKFGSAQQDESISLLFSLEVLFDET